MIKVYTPMAWDEKSLNKGKNPKGIIPSEQIIPFKMRIKEVIGQQSIMSFAKQCRLSDKTLRDYMSGKSYPTLDRLALIAEASGKSMGWLAAGEEPSAAPVVIKTSHVPDNMTEVLQLDVSVSAGPGAYAVAECPVARFELSNEWLAQEGLLGKPLSIVPVSGDSMSPTLEHGDLLLVELIHDPSLARNGICVFRVDDDVLVKRLQYDFNTGGYHVMSDNTFYKEWFAGEELQGRFHIIGRVARVLQRAKSV